jgi:hypothetical protein
MTDFRALCEELNGLLEYISDISPHLCEDEINNLTNSARAALAQPEPQGPTDEELIQLANVCIHIDTRLYRFQATAGDPVWYEMTEQQVHAFARAVLARWGRPATTGEQQ